MIFFVCSILANTVIDKLNELSLNTNPQLFINNKHYPMVLNHF
ncbi:MAG: hypothetical protein ACI8SC_002903, partial [Colwellia sp.]